MENELYEAAYYKAVSGLYNDADLPKAIRILEGLFPKENKQAIIEACTAALDLTRLGNWAGARYHDKILTSEQIVEQMREKRPGFSDKAYRDAMGNGIIWNR